MTIKRSQIARDVRVTILPHYIPSSLAHLYLATQEEFIFIREGHVYNDQLGEYVPVAGGSGMNSGIMYLRDIALEFPTEDNKGYFTFADNLIKQEQATKDKALRLIAERLRSTGKDYVWVKGIPFADSGDVVLYGVSFQPDASLGFLTTDQEVLTARDLDFRSIVEVLRELETEAVLPKPFYGSDWYAAKAQPVLHRTFYKSWDKDKDGNPDNRYLMALNVLPRIANSQCFKTFYDPKYTFLEELPEKVRYEFENETHAGYYLYNEDGTVDFTPYEAPKK